MQNKVAKNFRLSMDTVKKLDDLQEASHMSYTEIIENAIKYMHGEHMRAANKKEHDKVLLSQVLGNVKY